MTPDTTMLVAVLSSVFGFLFAVFLFLILRFTWRNRTLEPRSTSAEALRPGTSTRLDSQQWKDRWSTKRRGGVAAVSGTADDEVETQQQYLDDKTAGEFGANVHENGTRSYLNGWFALEAPPQINTTFRSHPARGHHERLRTKESNAGDEWEVKTEASVDSDPEAYRPQYATI